MPRRNQPPPVPVDTPDDVEARFYEALRHADLEGLMALWADDDEIVCVHPSGARFIGVAAIRASFAAIFTNSGIPVQPEQVRRLQQLGFALHHLVERIEAPGENGPQVGWVLSTNVYLKTALGWRVVAHHASPGMPHAMLTDGGDAPSTLH